MYAAKLRQQPQFKDIKRVDNQYNKFKNMQLNQLENIKKELELKVARSQSSALRNKLLEYRNKINYQLEMDRLTGYISQKDTRFPIGTVERLKNRQEELKKLGAKINE